ncbi:MAG TPA: TetR/AcrR family transcriptional regulator [Actinomycetales bacterium]|nr:TetR/AcrR family transcriptional regulator [Actinomycetales bacterium]
MNEPASRRMTGEERREQVLGAALRVFAEGGYAATTTDPVARAAGVSQPYVVRMFGTKQQLFAEVYRRACARVVEALAGVQAGPDAGERMGQAYIELLRDHDLLQLMMHGYVAGTDPEIGRIARQTLAEAYRLYRERSGGSPEDARSFVAHGMLINVLVASGAPDHLGEDPDVDDLTTCVMGEALDGIKKRAAG